MKSPFLQILLVALGVGCLALSMYDIKYIEGNSMTPTLRNNDTVIIFRWAYGLQPPLLHRYILRWNRVLPGDIVYYRGPDCTGPVVKRCAGAADTAIIVENDAIRVGGEKLKKEELISDFLRNSETIPDGKLFLLGDNRGVSYDSRHYGLVNEDLIEGRVIQLW